MHLLLKILVAFGISLLAFPVFICGIVLHCNTTESVEYAEFTITDNDKAVYTFEDIGSGTLEIDYYAWDYMAAFTVIDPSGDEIYKQKIIDEDAIWCSSISLHHIVNITESGDHTIIFEGDEPNVDSGFLSSDQFQIKYTSDYNKAIWIGTIITILLLNLAALVIFTISITIEFITWVRT